MGVDMCLRQLFSFTVNTHVHADHVTGTGKLKEALPSFKSVISAKSGASADKPIENGNIITFGTQVTQRDGSCPKASVLKNIAQILKQRSPRPNRKMSGVPLFVGNDKSLLIRDLENGCMIKYNIHNSFTC